MKKFFFYIIFLLFITFTPFLHSKKILVVSIQSLKNYSLETFYYDFSEIDSLYFFKFQCYNYIFPVKDNNIKDIINYLLYSNQKVHIQSVLNNYKVNDKVTVKNIFVIDLDYKILEKDKKKYYIFDICYPTQRKENKIIKFLKDIFNG